MIRIISAIASLFLSADCAANSKTSDYIIELKNAAPVKNLSQSYVGYDAEDFACGFNFRWMLNEGRKEFSNYCRLAGVRCLRFGEMSRYSWRGEIPTRMMIAAIYREKYPERPELARKTLEHKLNWWFKPDKFWTFCRENRIAAIPMINAQSYYDATENKGYSIINKPECYRKAAMEAAAYLKWLKDEGYLDMAKAWEIGNESYMKGWKPEEFAAFVKILIHELRKIQPDIKLGIPTFICSQDNPDVKLMMKRINTVGTMSKNKEWQLYENWTKWTAMVIKSLGKDAKFISYGIQHS